MRSKTANLLLLVLGAMFLQQTVATVGRNLPSVIAPAILDDLRLDPAWLGIYVAIGAAASLVFQLGCGGFILRHGAMRLSQAALAMLAVASVAAVAGPLWLFALSAIIGGGGGAVSTPASSHLLGRYSPPRYAPLVFSLKQTAVPVALLLAGLLGPLLTQWWGWRGAMLATAAACAALALALQPLRREFDADRVPTHPIRLSDFRTTLLAVTRGRELRRLSLACFACNGLQSVFIAYFVVYLTALGHGLATAGFVFSMASLIAVPGRVFWGWVGSVLVPPGVLIASLSIGMAVGAALLGVVGSISPTPVLWVLAACLSMTALSWNGVLLAEAARLAPPDRRGAATGGVLSFGQIGGLGLPLLYALTLGLTGSHGAGFVACSVPSLLIGVAMLRDARAEAAPAEHDRG
ncbi:MFS transporter [Falsiroseomonas sp. CW058]|uniref:MFS transporter n=1 Tax=Falsiroseomonas sp. CW058 TaxID=3388664 RepID=UPI003D3222C4